MKRFSKLFAVAVIATLASHAHAVPIFSPTNTILGGQSDGTHFNVGVEGTDADTNNWPGNESPDHAIDGVGQKYLNFGKLNTGFLVTPDDLSVVNSITLWTANDAEPRDPASYQLFGTNVDVSGGGPFALTDFTLIASGDLNLPSSRNVGGGAALDVANSQTIGFSNFAAYSSYLVLFPTVKDADNANSMQIGEVQLDGRFGPAIPEPATATLGLLAFGGMMLRRRRAA